MHWLWKATHPSESHSRDRGSYCRLHPAAALFRVSDERAIRTKKGLFPLSLPANSHFQQPQLAAQEPLCLLTNGAKQLSAMVSSSPGARPRICICNIQLQPSRHPAPHCKGLCTSYSKLSTSWRWNEVVKQWRIQVWVCRKEGIYQ